VGNIKIHMKMINKILKNLIYEKENDRML